MTDEEFDQFLQNKQSQHVHSQSTHVVFMHASSPVHEYNRSDCNLKQQIFLTGDQRLQLPYGPWILPEMSMSELTRSFPKLELFQLPPFETEEDGTAESDKVIADCAFWPECVEPLFDYGELPELRLQPEREFRDSLHAEIEKKLGLAEVKRWEKIAKNSCYFKKLSITVDISVDHNQYSKDVDRNLECLRTYIRNLEELDKSQQCVVDSYHSIELDWVGMIIIQKCICFEDYLNSIAVDKSRETQKWTMTRARRLVSALIPCIMYDAHTEEVLIDLLDEFILVFVLPNAVMESRDDPLKRQTLSEEILLMVQSIIQHLPLPVLIEKLFKAAHSYLLPEHHDNLYRTLFDIMIEFRVPDPIQLPKRDPLPADATKLERREYRFLIQNDQAKQNYNKDLIRVRSIQRERSFTFLKLLIQYFPQPILNQNSKWTDKNLLYINNIQIETGLLTETRTTYTAKIEIHPNQEFFDAMFYSKVLYACLNVNKQISKYIRMTLIPFIKANTTKDHQNTDIAFRLLTVINRFLEISRYNSVSNLPPPILHYRRYLIAYLIRNVSPGLGIPSEKIVSRCVSFQLHSLFEAIWLYQIIGPLSETDRVIRLENCLEHLNVINFRTILIFLTYNPIRWTILDRIFCKAMNAAEQQHRRYQIQVYREIFALVSEVPLLQITERHVLKHKEKSINIEHFPGKEEMLMEAQQSATDSEDGDFSDVPYYWSMSHAYKTVANLVDCSAQHRYPYYSFAGRIVLTRQFGISFVASGFNAQSSENITWRETVDFVNFFLERETQLLLHAAYNPVDLSVFRKQKVVDPQAPLHRQWNLPCDEPTHFIHYLLNKALTYLSATERQKIFCQFPYDKLFEMYQKTVTNRSLTGYNAMSPESAADLLNDIVLNHAIEELIDSLE